MQRCGIPHRLLVSISRLHSKIQWLGYGPEQLSIPSDFELPVSSFAMYGGHASIHIRFDNKATTPLYRIGDDPTGNNIEFIQGTWDKKLKSISNFPLLLNMLTSAIISYW